jgi:hypothetical protein
MKPTLASQSLADGVAHLVGGVTNWSGMAELVVAVGDPRAALLLIGIALICALALGGFLAICVVECHKNHLRNLERLAIIRARGEIHKANLQRSTFIPPDGGKRGGPKS